MPVVWKPYNMSDSHCNLRSDESYQLLQVHRVSRAQIGTTMSARD